jgi:hypothetical protein
VPEFPPASIAPDEFLESWLPRAFAEADVPDDVKGVDVALGLRLTGEGGGEWVLRVEDGALRVAAESRGETAFTFVQSVVDWRGALWEGRGGAIGQGAAGLFRPGGAPAANAGGMGGAPSLAALEPLRALDGVIRMVVSGGEGGDWSVAFKLGPGVLGRGHHHRHGLGRGRREDGERRAESDGGVHGGAHPGRRRHGPDDADAGDPDAGGGGRCCEGRQRRLSGG